MLTNSGFNRFFTTGKILGSGANAVVVEGKERIKGSEYAIKIVRKDSLDLDKELDLFTEVEILQSLNHDNIMKLHIVFNEKDAYYLVTEYLRGRELFDRIILKSHYTEKDARDVCRVLLNAINYCHVRKIAHRDLKPENLLLVDEESDTNIKIADFGFAARISHPNCLRTRCGSRHYMAPEIIRGDNYGEKVDLWSIGVIMYVLLSGYLPFDGENETMLFYRVVKGIYNFNSPEWRGVSTDAKELIFNLLQTDPEIRLSASEALNHKWMKRSSDKLRKFDRRESLERLKSFQGATKFRAAVSNIIAANNNTKGTKPTTRRRSFLRGVKPSNEPNNRSFRNVIASKCA